MLCVSSSGDRRGGASEGTAKTDLRQEREEERDPLLSHMVLETRLKADLPVTAWL